MKEWAIFSVNDILLGLSGDGFTRDGELSWIFVKLKKNPSEGKIIKNNR